jgi:D-amino-acid dehydrogenase
MFPPLGDVLGALHVELSGRVDGDRMRKALLGAAVARGARVEPGDVSLMVGRDRVTGVRVGTREIEADSVIVATGSWTNSFLAPVGLTVPIEPQRGQILHITMGDTDTSRWPVLTGTGGQYTLAFGPNRVVSGATRETGSGYDVRMTVGGLQSVFDHALKVSPGLAQGTVSEIRVGLRPLTPDGLPFIDRVPGYDNLVLAAGHGATGLQLGPYSGLLAANLATGDKDGFDLSPYAIGREISDHPHL